MKKNQPVQEITLTIEKMAGLGDGVATFEGGRVFVPYTTTGDIVTARIHRRTADASFATLLSLVTPGMDRIDAVCKHFGICGSCTLQHVSPETYSAFKQTMAGEAVRKAGYDVSVVAPMIALPAASRRRVDLKVEGGKIGYYEQQSHTLVDIEECKVLEPELLALILEIKSVLKDWKTVSTIQINGLDKGYDMLVAAEGFVPTHRFASVNRLSLRNGKTIRTLYQQAPVTLTIGKQLLTVPPGAFLQACKQAQAIMTKLVVDALPDTTHVLDLFAGIGTYSFPLLEHSRVTAIEGDSSMVEAMQKTTLPPDAHPFTASQRDLFQNPFGTQDLHAFDAVVINPPRTGAKAQVEQLALSTVPRIVMVSCNPATFTRDARILREGGYILKRVTPIDQFVYSSHLELVAEFIKA